MHIIYNVKILGNKVKFMLIKSENSIFRIFLYFFIVMSISTNSYGSSKIRDDQKFGDWTMNCQAKANSTNNVCSISQTLESKDDAKNKIASLKLRYSKDGILKLIATLPFGIKLQSGSYIISGGNDANPIGEGEFITCHDYGCIAHALLDEEEVGVIVNSDRNVLRITSMEGKLVDIPFSNKGLKEALVELKKRVK